MALTPSIGEVLVLLERGDYAAAEQLLGRYFDDADQQLAHAGILEHADCGLAALLGQFGRFVHRANRATSSSD